ncbi:DUF202 domain-containing protein [Isoptericola sp. NPDC019482]|uniref:DUF202 domain-containing protein n=1 Tax=Isoptericola sp. NPDC019482 TaxID=3154688 RepID=UPI0034695CCC
MVTPFDPGLQPERTALSWQRAATAFTVAGLVVLRCSAHLGTLPVVAACCALVLAAVAGWTGGRRRRAVREALAQDRHPGGGAALLLLALLTAAAAALGAVAVLAGTSAGGPA